MRIGIATGIVVVGDLVGQGSAQEQAVVGETPNLAARLQALAEPGSVVIAEATRRLLGGAFELTPLGPRTLNGFDAPVPAWTVLREAENVSRFEASRSQGMTPFVGREHEVALLLDRWRDATEGEGQVALLSGEAGIGKSRILAALRERIGGEPHVSVRYQCSPHHVNDAFYPIVKPNLACRGFCDRRPRDGEARQAGGDDRALGIGAERRSRLSSRPCCRSPAEGRYPPLEMAPSEQKERTIAALIALFEGLAKEAPVLVLLEDAHWIDPTSLDVFGRLVDRLPDHRALLVVTFRPEFAAPWVGRAHVASLTLSRFGRRQALAMVDRHHRRQGAAGRGAGADRRQDRRRAAVRRGTDQERARVRPAARGERRLCSRPRADAARDPLDPAELADGAPGSSRAGQGDRADRGGDRARVLLSPAGSGRRRSGAGDCRTRSRSSWRRN